MSIEKDHAIVCLVGENIRGCPRVSARVFAALGEIKTRMVSQGASQLNISLVVAAADLVPAVESLHREFFGEFFETRHRRLRKNGTADGAARAGVWLHGACAAGRERRSAKSRRRGCGRGVFRAGRGGSETWRRWPRWASTSWSAPPAGPIKWSG